MNSAEHILIAPIYEDALPQNTEAVAKNLYLRRRDERREQSKAAKLALRLGMAPSAETCRKSLHISLFFDGTNNNKDADSRLPISTSNVARLYNASIDHSTQPATRASHFSYYCPGVGTTFPDIDEYVPLQKGLVGAKNGEPRILWMLTRLLDALRRACGLGKLSEAETLVLVKAMNPLILNGQFQREAVFRPLMEELRLQLEKRQASQEKPDILSMRLYIYGFSRGAATARTFCNWLMQLVRQKSTEGPDEYRFAGLPISVDFLGLFDTVAAVGLADSFPFAAGHMSWASGTMRLPDEDTRLPEDQRFLKRCVHLVSAHEQRASFPMDSIRRRERKADGSLDTGKPSSYRKNTVEYLYPGMHSDIGGGYPPNDQGKAYSPDLLLSQITLHRMYLEAFRIGAPLSVPGELLTAELMEHEPALRMRVNARTTFDISSTVTSRFNTWQAQASARGSMPLEEAMEYETHLLTAWRIDRYHGGVEKTGFFQATKADESDEVWAAKKRLHAHKHEELERLRNGEALVTCEARLKEGRIVAAGDCQGYSATEALQVLNPLAPYSFDADLASIGGLEAYAAINTEKAYEPTLDRRQLEGAAKEFSADYTGAWMPQSGFLGDGVLQTISAVVTSALSGIVYLINEEDEAGQYASIREKGTERYAKLFRSPGQIAAGQEELVALFDDHIHDSRAWFMNSSIMGPRETWTDYFRYRTVYFDSESNKAMTPLLTATRVVGLAIAVGSVGLAVKRRDPRYLAGLLLPSLATPIIRGKLPDLSLPSLPEISAFDPLTGIAYPMMEGMETLRAYTRQPGEVLRQIEAMPLPEPLSEATANTPDLKTILQAAKSAKALKAAKDDPLAALEAVGDLFDPQESAKEEKGWLAQLGDKVDARLEIS